ncbi:FMN-binding protein MioC [Veronia nyctiphanis]|uniref:FMN-binding protein MioC n=1 Tax=Veronia nyctiphanis TaxID=1278244 RepID=A0A4Q0YQ88_9GAMM|nr:FMN-binding protein MioC [Veronia nyctiphanis]RXJ72184.1 FMN-binding protein MioC [Veronia nyctiphanis]
MKGITLITGSTLGGAEYVADHLSEILEKQGLNTEVINEAELKDLSLNDQLLLITSTHGAGDFPDTLAPMMEELESQKPDLSALNFAVIAIGDSSYDTFCGAGKKADSLLEQLGAKRVADRLDIDILENPLPEEPAEAWLSQWKLKICE